MSAMEASGRDRILDAAYDLFSRHGVRAVGVDAIVDEAGVAKATLYRNFASKDELALAFLREREQRWTIGWLQAEVMRRSDAPVGRLLAIFDVFGEWFASEAFDGCAFVNVVLEIDDRTDRVRQAGVEHLVNIRSFLREQVEAAGVLDVDEVTHQWHILMKGSIVAASEGDLQAARRAREMGLLLLERHQGERTRD
jgi:AcrR family transcriptional regulator